MSNEYTPSIITDNEPVPVLIGEAVANTINTELNAPCEARNVLVDISQSTEEALTVQPVASKRYKIARYCWAEEIILIVRYRTSTADNASTNLTFFSDIDGWQGRLIHVPYVGQVQVLDFQYNSPLDLNKYSVIEGYYDTDALANDLVAITNGFLTVRRIWCDES